MTKKLLFGIGSILAASVPTVAVISCGQNGTKHPTVSELRDFPSVSEMTGGTASQLYNAQWVGNMGNSEIVLNQQIHGHDVHCGFWGIITKVDVSANEVTFRTINNSASGKLSIHDNKILAGGNGYNKALIPSFDISTVNVGDFISSAKYLQELVRRGEINFQVIATDGSYNEFLIPNNQVKGWVSVTFN